MKASNRVLFIGRKNDFWSKKIFYYLKKNFKNVEVFYSSKYFEKAPKKIKNWKGDYILSFRSYLILSKKIINNAKEAAINFHPGPPEYRGIGCLNYAMYNGENKYGVTAHLMSQKIDNGKILKVQRFRIKKEMNLDAALKLTHKKLYEITINFIDKILSGKVTKKLILNYSMKYEWSKSIKSLKDLNDFYEIKKNISAIDLFKKIRATYTKKFKPYVIIHNKKFIFDDKK